LTGQLHIPHRCNPARISAVQRAQVGTAASVLWLFLFAFPMPINAVSDRARHGLTPSVSGFEVMGNVTDPNG
jgi:hypothetical protein